MPELPDIEHMMRGFKGYVLGKEISEVRVLDREYIRVSEELLRQQVEGHVVTGVERRGKYVVMPLDSGFSLVFHMGMTGRLELLPGSEGPSKYDKLILRFATGKALHYRCIRKLGAFEVVHDRDFSPLKGLDEMGIEPLSPAFTEDAIKRLASRHRRRMAKSFLMDQRIIAGIGNVYSDEILFQAGIHPEARMGQLSERKLAELYREIKRILHWAVDDYAGFRADDSPLHNHRRVGEPCPRCGTGVERIRVIGRSAYFCPNCQSLNADSRLQIADSRLQIADSRLQSRICNPQSRICNLQSEGAAS